MLLPFLMGCKCCGTPCIICEQAASAFTPQRVLVSIFDMTLCADCVNGAFGIHHVQFHVSPNRVWNLRHGVEPVTTTACNWGERVPNAFTYTRWSNAGCTGDILVQETYDLVATYWLSLFGGQPRQNFIIHAPEAGGGSWFSGQSNTTYDDLVCGEASFTNSIGACSVSGGVRAAHSGSALLEVAS